MGILLNPPNGTNISHVFKLEFYCTNKEANYKALIMGLISALKMGVRRFRVQGDSELII